MPGNNYVTDECVLASVLKDEKVNIANGSWNHCVLPNEMPLSNVNGVLHGSNPFDDKQEPIFCFHSDTSRRKPHERFSDESIKKILKESFYV